MSFSFPIPLEDAPAPWRMGIRALMKAPDAEPQREAPAENAELMRRISGGDRDALAELYDRMSRPLYSTAKHILSDASEAQDVVHDVFLSLWQNAGSFDLRKGGAFAWAVALTRNRAIDRLRSRANRARLLAESAPEDLGYGSSASGPSAGAKAESSEEARAVRQAMAGVPEEQRRALEMAFFSGLTQKEIAERLGEPIGTIKARIRRGLLRLRDTLAQRP